MNTRPIYWQSFMYPFLSLFAIVLIYFWIGMYVDIQFNPTGLIWLAIFVFSLFVISITGVRQMTLVKVYINTLFGFLPLAVALFHGMILVIEVWENLVVTILFLGSVLAAVIATVVYQRQRLQSKFGLITSQEMEDELMWAEYEDRKQTSQRQRTQFFREMAKKHGKAFEVWAEEEDEIDKKHDEQYKAAYKKVWVTAAVFGLGLVTLFRTNELPFKEGMLFILLWFSSIALLCGMTATLCRALFLMKQPYRTEKTNSSAF